MRSIYKQHICFKSNSDRHPSICSLSLNVFHNKYPVQNGLFKYVFLHLFTVLKTILVLLLYIASTLYSYHHTVYMFTIKMHQTQ